MKLLVTDISFPIIIFFILMFAWSFNFFVYRIATIPDDQTEVKIDENTESVIQQCPYSTNVYPMSSELYATDLEDILQSSDNDLLQNRQLNTDKQVKGDVAVTELSERLFSTQNEANSSSTDENRATTVTGIQSNSVENFTFSSSPMFVTTNPCTENDNSSGLTVNELASGSSYMPSSSQQLAPSSSNSNSVIGFTEACNSSTTFNSYSGPGLDIPMHLGDFRTSSPLLSSPSEQSSVISASPSSLSVASDSCSVAEICELLGESPSVCQQDFSFPGLSGKLYISIFCYCV